MLPEPLGNFLEYLGYTFRFARNTSAEYAYLSLLLNLIDDTWGEFIDHNITPPTTDTFKSSLVADEDVQMERTVEIDQCHSLAVKLPVCLKW